MSNPARPTRSASVALRLSPAEKQALQELAIQHGTTVTTLIRTAAMLVAKSAGAPDRADRKNRTAVTVTLSQAETEALDMYRRGMYRATSPDADERKPPTMEQALRSAVRYTLWKRGFITLPDNVRPDAWTSLAETPNSAPIAEPWAKTNAGLNK